MHTKFEPGNPEVKDHSENIGIDGIIMLEWIFGKWDEKMHLGQDRDQWQAYVNMVMNL